MGFCLFLVGFVVFAATADAQLITPESFCPDVTLKENFDMANFTGKWYEVMKYRNWFEADKKCSVDNYEQVVDGKWWENKFTVNTTWIGMKDGQPGNYTADVRKNPDDNDPGSLQIKDTKYQDWFQELVLDTDYDTFAVVYFCSNDVFGNRVEFLWIESRDECGKLDDATIKKILGDLESLGISTEKLVKADLSGCPECSA